MKKLPNGKEKIDELCTELDALFTKKTRHQGAPTPPRNAMKSFPNITPKARPEQGASGPISERYPMAFEGEN